MSMAKAWASWLRPATPQLAAAAGTMALQSTSRSHVGRVRAINEDRLLDLSEHRLWAVADGMGGHAAGDIAAEAAIAALQELACPDGITVAAVEAALGALNRQLHDRTRQGAPMSGATIVAMFERDRTMHILWAGDCRAYRLRDGRLVQLTRDHSVVQELLDSGALDPGQAARHPHAHVVTRALGAGETLVLDHVSGEIAAGDIYLLCSDGLAIPHPALEAAFGRVPQRLGAVADSLVEQALRSGGKDNISLVLAGYSGSGG